jgi:uncharacterized protein (TIGR02569 family)
VLPTVRCDGFRLAPPLRAAGGAVVVEGWTAWPYLDGEHVDGRWLETVAVGERFHAALAFLDRPSFIARRADQWAVGDRVAWGELPVEEWTHVKHVERLASNLRPVSARAQIVHGDLGGNVLYADGLAPAVIDLSSYWRPPQFASGVVVADALTWEGADETLARDVPEIAQYLLRALIYRAVTDAIARPGSFRDDADDPYLPAVEIACRLALG